MKVKYLVPMVAFGAMMSACSEDEFENFSTNKVSGNDRIAATVDDGRTRTELDEDNNINWTSGDKIAILTDKTVSSASDNQVSYELDGGVGTTSGSFVGQYSAESNGNKVAAFYPYEAKNLAFAYTAGASGGDPTYKITYDLPATITCTAASSTAMNGFPMAAIFGEDQNTIAFKNAAAVFDLTIENVPASYTFATLTSYATGESGTAPYLNGPAEISFTKTAITTEETSATTTYEYLPTLSIASTATTDNASTTTRVEFPAAKAARTVHVIVPIPVGQTYNLALAIGKTGSDNAETTLDLKKYTSVKATRNKRLISTVTLDAITAGTSRKVANAAAATTALAGDEDYFPATSVEVEEVEADGKITIPANQASGANPVSLLLDAAVSNAKLTVEAGSPAEGESTAVSNNVTITAQSSDQTSNFLDELNVTLPASAVTLAASDATKKVIYGKVTTSTATNKLVVEAGVTINELVVDKSCYVLVKKGGKVNTPSTTTTGVIMYYEDEVPKTTITGITFRPAEVYYICTLKKGESYQLTRDIKTDAAVTLYVDDVTLDLNGHTITATGTNHVVMCTGKNVLIKNVETTSGSGETQTITAKTTGGLVTESTGKALYAGNSCSVELQGVALKSGKTALYNINKGAVTLTNCTVTATGAGGNAICVDNATLIATGTSATISNEANAWSTVNVSNGGKLTLNNGTSVSTSSTAHPLAILGSSTEATLEGASVNGGNATYSAYIYNGATVTLKSGTAIQNTVFLNSAASLTMKTGASIESTSAEAVIVSNTASLQMDGGTITAQTFGVKVQLGGTASLSGGSILGKTDDALYLIDDNSEYGVSSATISGSAQLSTNATDKPTVFLQPLEGNQRAKMALSVSGSAKITNKGYFAISGNGTYHGTAINIEGSPTITTEGECAIYHPQDGTMTVSGTPTISGKASAIELRSGTLTISGGTFKATASSEDISAKKGSGTDDALVVANGNGTTTYGAAVAIAQHTTKKDVQVTITGGEFSGYYAFSQANPQNNTTTNVSLSIAGGTFTGKVRSALTGFISGGSFKGFEESLSTYLKSGYSLGNADASGYQPVSATSAAPRKR